MAWNRFSPRRRKIDATLFHLINGWQAPALDWLWVLLSHRMTWVIVGGVYILWAVIKRQRRHLGFAVWVGIMIGIADLFSFRVLKPAFARERPCHTLADVRLIGTECGGEHGFPSNHAANGMVAATLTLLVFRSRLSGLLLVAALATGFARVKVGVHYPGDVLGGWVLGALLGWLSWRIGRRWWPGGPSVAKAPSG